MSKDNIHLHVVYSLSLSVSVLVKKLKGRSSHHLQQEFTVLRTRYWGRYFWVIGYGVWSTGKIIDEMVQECLDHHKRILQQMTGYWNNEFHSFFLKRDERFREICCQYILTQPSYLLANEETNV